MNKLAQEQIHKDYREIISSEAGMRVLGGIFVRERLRGTRIFDAYTHGRRDAAVDIANAVYEVNPYGVADCLTAYEEFIKEHSEDERRDDTEPYPYNYDE